jgi:hypothetical protein
MAQHDDAIVSGLIIFGREGPAQFRLSAGDLEES